MNKTILIIVVLALVLLAFFIGYSLNSDNGQTNSYSSKESCESIGGEWGVFSNLPNAVQECNLPTLDVGEECTDSSQCESYCQAPEGSEPGSSVSGICYGFKTVTCMQEVRKGLADGEWCV